LSSLWASLPFHEGHLPRARPWPSVMVAREEVLGARAHGVDHVEKLGDARGDVGPNHRRDTLPRQPESLLQLAAVGVDELAVPAQVEANHGPWVLDLTGYVKP
jgi:hypothetical protein